MTSEDKLLLLRFWNWTPGRCCKLSDFIHAELKGSIPGKWTLGMSDTESVLYWREGKAFCFCCHHGSWPLCLTGRCTSLYPSLQLEGFQFVATVMNNATKTIAKIAGRTLILRYPIIFLYWGWIVLLCFLAGIVNGGQAVFLSISLVGIEFFLMELLPIDGSYDSWGALQKVLGLKITLTFCIALCSAFLYEESATVVHRILTTYFLFHVPNTEWVILLTVVICSSVVKAKILSSPSFIPLALMWFLS